ncbi:hypothetical protein ACMT1E_10930 [Sphingomonas flavalba]|uniref:hypothetical protein n=1 Tax=Sphingomonas flavalba TaxID=2559804 RepID=UPI0039E02A7B
MAGQVTIHLHNAAAGKDEALADAFIGDHLRALAGVPGLRQVQRFACSADQLLREIAQPWRYVTIYEFQSPRPAIDVPALAPPLADLRDAGLIEQDGTERIFSYDMYSDWKTGPAFKAAPFTHMMMLLANFTPGREAEYHRWYDEQHSVEVTSSPGYVAMKRGRLSPTQVPPYNYCPGDQLILAGIQTDDMDASLEEFRGRAFGRSPSGVAWGPRSTAASIARTVHIFKSVQGPFQPSDG